MQIVFRAGNLLEAHIVAGLLQSNGIHSHVSGHFLQGAVGELPAADFTHVFVDDSDVDAARRIIESYENPDA